MTESPKLLPCPFCGCANAYESPPGRGVVYCDNCQARTIHAGMWNHRAPDPEREAMAKVCEAAQARMDTYDKGEDYTGGIRSVEWNNLRAALADLERARKGEG